VGIVISAVFTCLGRLPLKCRVVEIQSLAHLSREVAPVHSSRKCALSLSERTSCSQWAMGVFVSP
jgi:hypothetical protein